MLSKFRYLFTILSLSLLFVSCIHPESTATSSESNIVTTSIPETDSLQPFAQETTTTPTPPPSSNFIGDEITFLLRTRSQPIKLMVVVFSVDCLIRGASCDQTRASWILPANLYQIWNLTWTPDGKRALFWDSDTGDVYTLNDNSGEITKIRSKVWKARSDFFVSPDGEKVIFEIDSGVFETDIVSMNIHTGEMTTFDIPIPCMKFVSGWLTNNEFLFWCEKYSGDKGYLENVEVYTFNLETHAVQLFEINRDWMQTSVPKPAPNGRIIAFTNDKKVIIRDLSTAQENFFDLNPESYIWSLNSDFLAVYTQNREIFAINLNSKRTEMLYSLPENTLLEDWLWLPDNKGLLLVMANEDNENRTTVFCSISNHSTLVVDSSLFDAYDVVSISHKPMLDNPTP